MVDRATMGERTTLQTYALIMGVAFLLAGILGFIPGITPDAPGKFIGEESDAELLGLFKVSIVHNLVHLVFGIAGLALARTWDGARNFLLFGGIIYLALWLLGLIGLLEWLPANTADHWLHFFLALGLLGGYALFGRERAGRTAAA